MADTAIDTLAHANLNVSNLLGGPIWVNEDIAYIVYKRNTSRPAYRKSINGGTSWDGPTDILTSPVTALAVWYDRWTPGNSGTKIHVVYLDATAHKVYYRSLDIVDDSFGTEITVFTGSSFEAASWVSSHVSIVRSRNGNLYIGFWGDNDGEFGFYRSTDSGATWSSRAQLADGNAVDGILLMPGNETDPADIWCIYHDRSFSEISLKVYDDSDNSWSETLISSGIESAATSGHFQYAAAPRHSDGHVILAAWNEYDSATADLLVWDLASSTDFTALTNVVTNLGESAEVSVLINQMDSTIYVAYIKGVIWQATADVKYKKSTDGGTTWEAEEDYSEATEDDIRGVWSGISVGLLGGKFQPMWFNDDLNDLFHNLVNSVDIEVPSGPFRAAYTGARVDAVPSGGSAVT